jgi:hypothetical protein
MVSDGMSGAAILLQQKQKGNGSIGFVRGHMDVSGCDLERSS